VGSREYPAESGPIAGQAKLDSLARSVSELIVVFLIYVVSARLGLMMGAVSGFATLVWPPTGIALVALLLRGVRLWPAVMLGAFVANIWTGAPFWVALGIGLGNTLEAVLAVYLLTRLARFRVSLDRLLDVVALVALAAALSTVASATIGVLALGAGGIVKPGHLGETWRAWWLGDALGDLVVAPVLLTWSGLGVPPTMPSRRMVEALGLAVFSAGMSYFIFLLGSPLDSDPFRQAYMLFPVLIWAAIRFGLRGVTATILLTSAIAIWGTSLDHGPFVRETLDQSLFGLQAFMAVATVTTLVLAAALAERKEAVKSREDLLAMVSHDMKNPLGAIRISTHHLLKQPPDELGPNARKQAEAIERYAQRIAALISNLLDAATIRAGHLSLIREPQDLAALVNDAVETIRPLMEQKAQTIRIEIPSALRVNGDRERILQVLSNLLGNAVKFAPERGHIMAQAAAQDGWAHCFISDDGPGIEPDKVQHVFKPYWKGESGQGTGLGLSIAKGIVEAHGGRTSVQSQTGIGTTIAFTLPLGSGRPSAPAVPLLKLMSSPGKAG
jgi:signal transduction histidine kinase